MQEIKFALFLNRENYYPLYKSAFTVFIIIIRKQSSFNISYGTGLRLLAQESQILSCSINLALQQQVQTVWPYIDRQCALSEACLRTRRSVNGLRHSPHTHPLLSDANASEAPRGNTHTYSMHTQIDKVERDETYRTAQYTQPVSTPHTHTHTYHVHSRHTALKCNFNKLQRKRSNNAVRSKVSVTVIHKIIWVLTLHM